MPSLESQAESPARHVGRAVCPYCGVGCVVTATVESNRITKIAADDDVAPNYGKLCPKGAYLKDVFHDERRLKYPMIRHSKDEPLRRVGWDEAISFVARRMHEISDEHGPDALAFYGSGQLDTEASYLFTKLYKGYLGTNNMDTNSRLCMSSAVAGYTRSFGADGPPTSYEDIHRADVFLIIGANMADCHPVIFNMLKKRRATADHVRTIVVDPRKTKTVRSADVHVQLKPGSDVAFLQLVAKGLLKLGRVDTRFIKRCTEDFDEYKRLLDNLDEDEMLDECGVPRARIDEVIYHLSRRGRLLSFYCQGMNQSTCGVDKNTALINLHLQLGEVGKPGAGPFSLTGQPNAMGGREVGYLSHQLPGYRYVQNSADRRMVEALWDLPSGRIRSEPGLTAVPMFEACARGEVRALWIAATNPAVSMPDTRVAQTGMRRADLVVVQDCYYPTETTGYADVLLPAAQWGEKAGTMTNSERLVVRSEKFLDPPGEARPDWWIAASVARAMEFDGFGFDDVESVWDEFRHMTVGTKCDQFGMSNERLRQGPLRWPCPTFSHAGTTRLYERGHFATSNGKARFVPRPFSAPDEDVDETYPLILTTGRVASQWHTRTRTGLVPALNKMDPEPFVQMHPEDAADHRLEDSAWVRIETRRGAARGKLVITEDVRRGMVFMPFHWGDLFDAESNVNYATNSAFDPTSKQPELKVCAVRVKMCARNGFEPKRFGDRDTAAETTTLTQNEIRMPEPSIQH